MYSVCAKWCPACKGVLKLVLDVFGACDRIYNFMVTYSGSLKRLLAWEFDEYKLSWILLRNV